MIITIVSWKYCLCWKSIAIWYKWRVLSVKERCPWVCLYTDAYSVGWRSEEALASHCFWRWTDSILRRLQANWALLSHSLGCFTGEMVMAPFLLSNSSWLSSLPCCMRAKLEQHGIGICTFPRVGPTCPMCDLCVLRHICIVFNWKNKTLLLWCPKIKAANGHRENSWGTTAHKWLEVLEPILEGAGKT